MNVLDLFSGIGGFSLGLERAGMRTVAFCEIDEFCRRVLRKHWPQVYCHDDITTRVFREGEADIICGGFPCQDISTAGTGAGLAGERSGLWRELVRAIRLVRPRYAIVENVAALLSRGMGDVLRDLAEIGYDAEWHCIPASAIGAPHRRDRIWIVAHPQCGRCASVPYGHAEPDHACSPSPLSHAISNQLRDESGWRDGADRPYTSELADNGKHESLADAESDRRGEAIWPLNSEARCGPPSRQSAGRDTAIGRLWLIEPNVGRVAHGVPARVDRLRALGNAVVPQIPEIIGRAIMTALSSAVRGEE